MKRKEKLTPAKIIAAVGAINECILAHQKNEEIYLSYMTNCRSGESHADAVMLGDLELWPSECKGNEEYDGAESFETYLRRILAKIFKKLGEMSKAM